MRGSVRSWNGRIPVIAEYAPVAIPVILAVIAVALAVTCRAMIRGSRAVTAALRTEHQRACYGTPEFTHAELTDRAGVCYVCGGYGYDA